MCQVFDVPRSIAIQHDTQMKRGKNRLIFFEKVL
jgi:hypothetical protein